MTEKARLDQLDSPGKIHAYLLTYNWDGGEGIPRLLVAHPECDRGTALMCYWVGGASYFQRYADRSSVPGYELSGYDFVVFVESHLLNDRYRHNTILFNPYWDQSNMANGYNWVTRYPQMPGGRQIPLELKWPNLPDPDWEAAGRPGL